MLNLFGIDVTEYAENEASPADAFIVRQVDNEQDSALAELQKQFEDAVENGPVQPEKSAQSSTPGLSPLLELLKAACLFGAVMMFLNLNGVPFDPAVCLIGGICFVGWLLLFLRDRTLRKQAAECSKSSLASEFETLLGRMKLLLEQRKAELGIPESAAGIDFLAEQYITENGIPKHISIDGVSDYLNLERYAYVENGSLFLANAAEVMEIPLSSLRSMKKLKQLCSFADWNKSEPHTDKRFRRFRIKVSRGGVYSVHCCQIAVADARGDCYLLIPEYEADAFSVLTGLHPNK